MSDRRTFVGFGFGPIQSGLFLYEAFRTGRFSRLVVAEIDPRLVEGVNANAGRYSLNIAHPTHIETWTIEGVEMLNPRVPADRAKLLEAIADADELATALPSVAFFDGDASSVVQVLADALRSAPAKSRLLYAAENHNHAAEILTDHLRKRLCPATLAGFQVANTVIGKMSGVITDPQQLQSLKLAPLTPSAGRAILVEAFNRILISRVTLPQFFRGIDVFIEKDDLLPFEEAKLYGHNAIHALIGYLAHRAGLADMSQVALHAKILDIARRAFIDESGAALIQKYAHLQDPFFTPAGYQAYADDLLQRMVNPNLQDLVARVIRDPQRKLGFHDRLYGTMHLALQQGITPTHMALGAAAGVEFLLGQRPTSRQQIASALQSIWGPDFTSPHAARMIDLTWQATGALV